MADTAVIASALSSIKAATDIAKFIKDTADICQTLIRLKEALGSSHPSLIRPLISGLLCGAR